MFRRCRHLAGGHTYGGGEWKNLCAESASAEFEAAARLRSEAVRGVGGATESRQIATKENTKRWTLQGERSKKHMCSVWLATSSANKKVIYIVLCHLECEENVSFESFGGSAKYRGLPYFYSLCLVFRVQSLFKKEGRTAEIKFFQCYVASSSKDRTWSWKLVIRERGQEHLDWNRDVLQEVLFRANEFWTGLYRINLLLIIEFC